jgi:hypothetical protein
MATPHTFEDTLRVHDIAIFNWIGKLRVDYGTRNGKDNSNFPILRVLASPERAFAKIVDLLVRLCWIDGATADAMRNNADDFAVLPLPIATIRRGDPVPDAELRGTPKSMSREFFNLCTGQWENHPYPAAYRIPYQITFWSKKRYTEAYMREWLMSQFGQIGMTEVEILIDVVHDPPWGTQQQALRFDGTSDLSDLEGEGQRYIRYELSVNLRAWMYRVSDPDDGTGEVGGEYPVDKIGWDTTVDSTAQDIMCEGGEDAQNPAREEVQSENYHVYRVPSSLVSVFMPTTGDAAVDVACASPPGLPTKETDIRLTVEDQADTVEIGEWPICPDDDGVAIFGTSFWYQSKDGRVEMEILQRDVTTPEVPTFPSADSFILPQTKRWEQFHRFYVVRGTGGPANVENRVTLIKRIAGIPNQPAQTVDLHCINIRHILPQPKVAATTVVDAGTEFVYQWTGLAKRPYLVIIVLATTSGGSGIVVVEDDLTHPKQQYDRALDATVNAGAAFLIQPDRDALALHVPKTLTVEDVHVQEFKGSYTAHTVEF